MSLLRHLAEGVENFPRLWGIALRLHVEDTHVDLNSKYKLVYHVWKTPVFSTGGQLRMFLYGFQ